MDGDEAQQQQQQKKRRALAAKKYLVRETRYFALHVPFKLYRVPTCNTKLVFMVCSVDLHSFIKFNTVR